MQTLYSMFLQSCLTFKSVEEILQCGRVQLRFLWWWHIACFYKVVQLLTLSKFSSSTFQSVAVYYAVQDGKNVLILLLKSQSVTIQPKAIEQYFSAALFVMLYKVIRTFWVWMRIIQKCGYSTESYCIYKVVLTKCDNLSN